MAIELCSGLTGEALADVFRRAHKKGLSVIATTPDMTIGGDELRSPALRPDHESLPDLTERRDALLIMGMSGTAIPSRLVTASGRSGQILNSLNSSWQYRKIFTVAERRRFDASRYFGRASAHVAPTVDANRILGAGGHILLGSGAPLAPRGLGLHVEMRRLATSGLQPFQILKMTSLDAARTLGIGESLGIVRVGQLADLVILDGDPLTRIDAAISVVGTIANGRYYSRKDLTTPGLRALARNP